MTSKTIQMIFILYLNNNTKENTSQIPISGETDKIMHMRT